MKTCGKCKEHKPLDHFYSDKSKPDGRRYCCIACDRSAQLSWCRDNKGKAAAKTARRRNIKRQATPDWADKEEIKRIYELAAWVSHLYNEPFHVDHIIPIAGSSVCGLHVEQNLRIIPATENISKSNKLIEELL